MKPVLIEPLETRIAPASVISISGPSQVAEGSPGNDTTLTYTISLSEASGTDVVVDCLPINGTATHGVDFDMAAGPRTIFAGTLSTTLSVTIHGDASYEVDETFQVALGQVTGDATVSPDNGSVTTAIQNDDVVPTITISDATHAEGNAGPGPFNFTISLSDPAGVPVSVRLTSSTGTADSSDFTPVDEIFTIEPGLASKQFSVTVNGDSTPELDETFTLTLSEPVNATPGNSTATGTIHDDDTANFSVDDVSVIEGTDAKVKFTVRLSSALGQAVTIDYSTANGSATAGSDYTLTSGTLTFAAGATQMDVEVPLTDDLTFENTETFSFHLSNPSSGSILDGDATATISDNDGVPVLKLMGPGGQQGTVTLEEGNAPNVQNFTLSLDHASGEAITVHLSSANGSATAGSDFVAIDQNVVFAPGETTKTIPFTITGDAVDETDETLSLTATLVSGTVSLPAATTVKLRNDERLLTVSDMTIQEGDAGTKQLIFTVTLNAGSPTHDISLDYSTANGTALAGQDFVGVSTPQTLTFTGGQTSRQIVIDVAGDTIGEPDEYFTLNFTNVTNALINKTSVRGTIQDNDPFLSITDAKVVEGPAGTNTTMNFTVQLLRAPAATPVTVNFQTADAADNKATAGDDYVATSGTLTFAPGETIKTIPVSIIGDATVFEHDETFLVKLSGASNGLADTQATGTILDDEGIIVVSNATLVEGDSGTADMVFVVNLVGLPTHSGNVSVLYTTQDGTAVSTGVSPDFTAKSGTLVFGANVTQQTISVPVRGDLVREGDQTFQLVFSNANIPRDQQASIGTPSATGTIVDNDPLPTLSISGGSVVEGASGAQIVFTVALSGGAESPITVDFATIDGAAKAGSDYTAVSQPVTFEPGSVSKPIAVPVLDDTDVEGDEAFTAKLSNAAGATIGSSVATGTIKDDDITVTLSAGDFASAVAEGNSGPVKKSMTVTLSAAPKAGQDVLVSFAVTPGTATAGSDFALTNSSTTLRFSSTDPLSKTIDFNVIGDTRDEADETFSVALTGSTNAVLGATTTQLATIADDDATPTITIDDAQVIEGNSGTLAMNFTVRLSAASGQAVTVLATPTADGDATAADFSTSAQTITFAPGETVKTLAVNITGDTIDEADETFHVLLTAPANAGITDGSALGTIVDNDARSLTIADETIVEGDAGTKTRTFTVTLSSANSRTVTVDWFTADGSATAGSDYVAVAPTPLVFNPGDPLTKTVSVTINGDTTAEADEAFFVRLQPHAGTPVNAVIVDGEATGTIQNDEMQFVLDTATALSAVEESATGGKITFTIKRTGDTSRPGQVSYTTENGTAKSSGAFPDFVAKTGTVLFAAGDETKTVTIDLVDDLNHEANETFKLKLTGAVNGVVGSEAEQTATITGSDALPQVEILDTSITEGASGTTLMTFTVRLRSGGVTVADEAEAITVTYHTETDGKVVGGVLMDGALDDVTAQGVFKQDFDRVISGTLTFDPGTTTKTFTINVKGDIIDEKDDAFRVKLDTAQAATSGSPTNLTFLRGTATGTIIDDDDAPLVTFAGSGNGDITVSEGSLGNFVVKPKLQLVVGAGGATTYSEKPVTLTLTTTPGTATAGVDFIDNNGTSVTIPAGDSTKELEYTVVGDSIHEANETFSVSVSNPVNVRVGDGGMKVTITDDDATPQLVISNATAVEGDSGTTAMTFTVALQGATDQTVTVKYASADDTAVSKGALPDFTAVSGTLSFAPGETTKTITVPIIGDTWAEADEAFKVTLSGQTNATILTATGTGTILNGGDSVVGLVVQNAVSVENPLDANGTAVATPTITFKVELTKALAEAATFTAATRNGTAIATGNSDSDYVALSQNFSIAAGQTSANVAVTLKPDSTFESTEYFFLGIGGLSNNVVEARGEGRGVILNDDLAFVDTKTLIYIDEDGDLATLKITKGNLGATTLTFGPVNQSTGGRTLQLIDFTGAPSLFNGTDLRITATAQTGFAASGKTSDGHVDVGFIRGGIPDTGTLQFLRGIDFGSIVVPGDVGKITAGDSFITPSIKGKISVESLGVRGTATGAPDNISAFLSTVNAIDVKGDVQGIIQAIGSQYGSINSLKIGGALRGTSDATKQSAIIFFTGSLGSATIGDIIGGAASDSGVINGNTNFTAKIGSIHVLGDIVGGKGTRSGRIVAKAIGSVTVDGDVIGGGDTGTDSDGSTPKGSDSGEILATSSITSVKIGGDLIGGTQRNTGIVSSAGSLQTLKIGGDLVGGTGSVDSGVVIVNKTLANMTIGGDVIGAAGERSGTVQVGGTLTKFTVGIAGGTGGDVKGGSGEDSGTISAGAGIDQQTNDFVVSGGSIGSGLIYGDIVGGKGDGSAARTGSGSGGVQVGGTLTKLDVRGSIIGGDSPAAGTDTTAQSMTQSGFVLAGRLSSMIVGGDLVAGNNFGSGLADSGSIRVHENIGSLTIRGNVLGNATNSAVISAGNNGPTVGKTITPAIATLTVGTKAANGTVTGGNVSFLEVLAGYGEFGSTTAPRGIARTADAQIGTVTFLGNMLATNIAAGADAGADDLFGTADDLKLFSTPTNTIVDRDGVISSIAKVVIGGQVLDSEEDHGIVAERVGAVIIGGTAVALTAGAGNDPVVTIPDVSSTTKMQVNELTA